MQFSILSTLAILATVAVAMPGVPLPGIAQCVDCANNVPACSGGSIVGGTNCRCVGQHERCDLWVCPGSSTGTMVCGQDRTGCVWL